MSIGVFDVATSGEDESRLRKQAQRDKEAAAVYDVRQKFGHWLFGASDSDAFEDRFKLSHVDICKTIEPHIHAGKGAQSRVFKALKAEWRERQAGEITACWPGCHENEAHAKKFHKDKKDSDEKEARRTAAEDGAFERNAPDHPEQHIEQTYHPHDGEKLIPEGNFDAYKDRVDQGGPEKVESHAFIPGENDHHYDADEGRNFTASYYNHIAKLMTAVGPPPAIAPTQGAPSAPPPAGNMPTPTDTSNPISATPGAAGAGGTGTQQPIQPMASHQHIAMMMQAEKGQRWATAAILEGGVMSARRRLVEAAHSAGVISDKAYQTFMPIYSSRKVADKDYLRQADEALTKVLNEQAEQFQQTIAPLQQALITVQQAQQLQNPLNVSPPAGTVNVLPGQGGQQQPGAGSDPTGMTADPAAAALAGQQPAASAMQQTARRKRGGRGKA